MLLSKCCYSFDLRTKLYSIDSSYGGVLCVGVARMGRGFVTHRCTRVTDYRVSDRVGSSGHRIMNLRVCRITGQKFKLGSVTA